MFQNMSLNDSEQFLFCRPSIVRLMVGFFYDSSAALPWCLISVFRLDAHAFLSVSFKTLWFFPTGKHVKYPRRFWLCICSCRLRSLRPGDDVMMVCVDSYTRRGKVKFRGLSLGSCIALLGKLQYVSVTFSHFFPFSPAHHICGHMYPWFCCLSIRGP